MEWIWVPPRKCKQSKKRQKGRQKGRPNPTNRRTRSIVDSLSPFFIERLRRVLSGQEIGPAPRGAIRLAYLPKDYTVCWKVNVLTSHDRTLREWHTCIYSYLVSYFPYTVPVDPNPHNPFFGRTLFANEMTEILLQNLRYRWLLRKYIHTLRLRIMNRRVIGTEDLSTTVVIPKESLVEVYDLPSRSVYRFHTQTIMRIILNSLSYSSYGIACPLVAKNPYTNIAFTMGQLIRIVEQITINLARFHRMIPDPLFSYRMGNYNIATYFNENKLRLHLHAASTFFANKEDRDVIEIYGEIMEDVYVELREPLGMRAVTEVVKNRKARSDLQKRWDTIVRAFWVYQNHTVFVGWLSYRAMVREFELLHEQTYELCRIQRVRPRPVSHLNVVREAGTGENIIAHM